MKQFGLTETKLFHFHRIFKIGEEEWGSSEPPEPPLDPPLKSTYVFNIWKGQSDMVLLSILGQNWVSLFCMYKNHFRTLLAPLGPQINYKKLK